jgi:NhaA family Na+:H+ antiporter
MIREFLRLEAASGIILAIAAAFGMLCANSAAKPLYDLFLNAPVVVQIGALKLAKPLLLWINDGLMGIFFLLVGLEIKREILQGELSSRAKAVLPVFAAVGGMIAPAAIYVFFNASDPVRLRGWAIPSATDIAFALGVIALLGSRIPSSLKVFLLALAIIDDLGAIVIIAFFYTVNVSGTALGLAGAGLVLLFTLNRLGVTRVAPYVLVGIFLWVCVLESGIHATLAGVALAFAIPLRADTDVEETPFSRLEHALHPWVAYGVLPLFAFANAGVSLAGLSMSILLQPVPLGIAAGLFVGKQLGVFVSAWGAVKLGVAGMPKRATWAQLYGVAVLCGIGFTMSLFIGGLAFDDQALSDHVRIGVLTGSLLSALCGLFILRLTVSSARPVAQANDH